MLSTTDKMLFLKRVSLFSGMTLEQLRVLTSHMEEQHFLPGEVIMYEGDFSQELYVLVSGLVRIAKDYSGPHERTLVVLTQGDFFGDMAIFESAPRSATAVTEEEAELLVLSPEKFKQTIYQKPDSDTETRWEVAQRVHRGLLSPAALLPVDAYRPLRIASSSSYPTPSFGCHTFHTSISWWQCGQRNGSRPAL